MNSRNHFQFLFFSQDHLCATMAMNHTAKPCPQKDQSRFQMSDDEEASKESEQHADDAQTAAHAVAPPHRLDRRDDRIVHEPDDDQERDDRRVLHVLLGLVDEGVEKHAARAEAQRAEKTEGEHRDYRLDRIDSVSCVSPFPSLKRNGVLLIKRDETNYIFLRILPQWVCQSRAISLNGICIFVDKHTPCGRSVAGYHSCLPSTRLGFKSRRPHSYTWGIRHSSDLTLSCYSMVSKIIPIFAIANIISQYREIPTFLDTWRTISYLVFYARKMSSLQLNAASSHEMFDSWGRFLCPDTEKA